MAENNGETIAHSEGQRDALDELQATKKRMRVKVVGFTTYVLILILCCGFYVKSQIQGNFSQDRIRIAIDQKWQGVRPLLPIYTKKLIQGVPETFIASATQELKKNAPVLKGNLAKETVQLQRDLQAYFEKQLRERFGDQYVKDKLAEMNTGDLSAEDIERNRMHIVRQMNQISRKASSHVSDLFMKDITELMEAIRSFPRDSQAKLSEEEAAKLFAHYMINVLDKEIMEN